MPGPVSQRLAGVQRRLTTVGNTIALDAAKAVADAVTAQVGADGGGLSNYRGGGPIRVAARAQGANTAEVVPTSGAGQLGIMEQGAKRHRIGDRGQVMPAGTGFAYGPFNHPGAPARRTFTKGTTRGTPAARTAAAKALTAALNG